MKILTSLTLAVLAGSLSAAPESFEQFKAGEDASRIDIGLGSFASEKEMAKVISGHFKSGKQSLHILGGEKELVLNLKSPLEQDSILSFWSERWTRQAPFGFQVDVKINDQWEKLEDLSKVIQLGGFKTLSEFELKKGTQAIRWIANTPKNSGVMIDDLSLEVVGPMVVNGVETAQPVIPVLVRKEVNPVMRFTVQTSGGKNPHRVEAFEVNLEGTDNLQDVESVSLLYSGRNGNAGSGKVLAQTKDVKEKMSFKANAELGRGENHFWVSVRLKDGASIDGRVDAGINSIRLSDGNVLKPEVANPEGSQRIGVALRQRGDDKSKAFRIPGLVTTNNGTLIGVYDARWRNGGDLPGDIDVGMSRSTDGGQTWEKMKIIMDMGNDPKWGYDGVGDPAVLVDRSNNRIWVAGVWSHGNRAWHGSGQGLKPEETGQFMLVCSDDDGKTWSKPMNITQQVKKPEWHYLLQGPGAGITMKDGTLVFAAQYQDGDKRSDGRKKGTPFSTIIYSKDHGKTWHCGEGIKSDTTEAQVVELSDGSLMLNCRDNRGGSRTVGVTRDLGKTWEMHPTDRSALNEPVCMASLYRYEREGEADLLLFSNPNTKGGRHNMTIKVSSDEGLTWPEGMHTLYDSRSCSGYSCLTRIGEDKVGVLYEGPVEIYFLRFGIDELTASGKQSE